MATAPERVGHRVTNHIVRAPEESMRRGRCDRHVVRPLRDRRWWAVGYLDVELRLSGWAVPVVGGDRDGLERRSIRRWSAPPPAGGRAGRERFDQPSARSQDDGIP